MMFKWYNKKLNPNAKWIILYILMIIVLVIIIADSFGEPIQEITDGVLNITWEKPLGDPVTGYTLHIFTFEDNNVYQEYYGDVELLHNYPFSKNMVVKVTINSFNEIDNNGIMVRGCSVIVSKVFQLIIAPEANPPINLKGE